jgi:hypothetical protein
MKDRIKSMMPNCITGLERVKYRTSEKYVYTCRKWVEDGVEVTRECTVFAMGISTESDPNEHETKVTFDTG